MRILYLTSREYDPGDELRIPPDDPEIGYDWKTLSQKRKSDIILNKGRK